MSKKTVNHKKLMELGFPEHTSRDIIRQAKAIAVQEFKETSVFSNNMIELSKSPFDNRRLGIAPAEIVEQLIGIPLSK